MTIQTLRSKIQAHNRAQWSLIRHAICRGYIAWFGAAIIVLSGLNVKLTWWWAGWMWVVVGAPILIVLMLISWLWVRKDKLLALKLYQRRIDINIIQEPSLRMMVESALNHQREIVEKLVKRQDDLMQFRLSDMEEETHEWVDHIYRLAVGIEQFEANKSLHIEIETLPHEVSRLIAQLDQGSSPVHRTELEKLIAAKKKHLKSLHSIDAQMRQGRLKIEQSLTSMRHAYSQIYMIDSRNINGGEAQRIQSDIREQVAGLGDLVDGIQSVYGKI